MSNKITTYNINSKETISVNVGGNACIQSQSVLSIQFTNQVGSFQLLDNMDITEGQIYVTNNGEFPTIFVIADMLTPVEELYIFDDESTPSNVTIIEPGNTAYYVSGDNLNKLVPSTYPLQKNYTTSLIGRSASQPSFTQYSFASISTTNINRFKFSDDGVISESDVDGAVNGFYGCKVSADLNYMGVFGYT